LGGCARLCLDCGHSLQEQSEGVFDAARADILTPQCTEITQFSRCTMHGCKAETDAAFGLVL